MKKSVIFSGICILFSISFSSCLKNDKVDLYVPAESDTTANASLEDLQQGRELYIDNCKSCHNLYSPDEYSASQWNSILTKMAPRTNMTESEIILVKKYITRGM